MKPYFSGTDVHLLIKLGHKSSDDFQCLIFIYDN